MPRDIDAPDGWKVIESAGPYTKIVKRDAVHVPRRPHGDGFHRDAVVIVTDDIAGVVKGPGARQSWQVADPEGVGATLAETVEEWVTEGGDPYGGSELNDRLDSAATEYEQTRQVRVEEVA